MSNIYFFEDNFKIDAEIVALLKTDQLKMEIICYGAGLFGDTITHVLGHNSTNPNKTISVEVVVCDPEPYCINLKPLHQKDCNDLTESIKKLRKATPNIKVYPSKIIPTVRGCAIFNTNQLIYCYYQPYYFYPQQCFSRTEHGEHLLHANKGGSPIIIARNGDSILDALYRSLKLEFERLKRFANTAKF